MDTSALRATLAHLFGCGAYRSGHALIAAQPPAVKAALARTFVVVGGAK